MSADHLGRDLGLELIEPAFVEQTLEHCARVVAHAVVGGQEIVQFRGVALGRLRGRDGTSGGGESRHVGADAVQTLGVVLGPIVRYGADGGVGPRAAQRFPVHGLAGRALHEVGAAESHERRAVDHEDHVRERGQVGAPGDARSHHGGDLRHAQVVAHQ